MEISFRLCLVTCISLSIIGITKVVELLYVVYLCCSNGLFHTYLSLPFSRKTEKVYVGLKDLSLTNNDIQWYTLARCDTETIESCGEFANVPLIGTQGGINYNPVLARRQLGYANSTKPIGPTVEGYFYREGDNPKRLKARMVKAWYDV